MTSRRIASRGIKRSRSFELLERVESLEQENDRLKIELKKLRASEKRLKCDTERISCLPDGNVVTKLMMLNNKVLLYQFTGYRDIDDIRGFFEPILSPSWDERSSFSWEVCSIWYLMYCYGDLSFADIGSLSGGLEKPAIQKNVHRVGIRLERGLRESAALSLRLPDSEELYERNKAVNLENKEGGGRVKLMDEFPGFLFFVVDGFPIGIEPPPTLKTKNQMFNSQHKIYAFRYFILTSADGYIHFLSRPFTGKDKDNVMWNSEFENGLRGHFENCFGDGEVTIRKKGKGFFSSLLRRETEEKFKISIMGDKGYPNCEKLEKMHFHLTKTAAETVLLGEESANISDEKLGDMTRKDEEGKRKLSKKDFERIMRERKKEQEVLADGVKRYRAIVERAIRLVKWGKRSARGHWKYKQVELISSFLYFCCVRTNKIVTELKKLNKSI